jgi:hypothetical protein
MESEPRREVGIDLGLALSRQLQLTDADEPADTLVSVYASTHRSIIPDDGNLPLWTKSGYMPATLIPMRKAMCSASSGWPRLYGGALSCLI